jgi:hypothetical protein
MVVLSLLVKSNLTVFRAQTGKYTKPEKNQDF